MLNLLRLTLIDIILKIIFIKYQIYSSSDLLFIIFLNYGFVC